MKKLYLAALLATFGGTALSQGFIIPTSYRGAFAPEPETPWTANWTNWDPQNTNYPAATVNVTANITNNTTWTAGNTYLLQGQIYVKNGATLTIEPGTVVLGDKNTTGSGLFITQGAKLNASGTEANPIVFTSNQPAGQRALGDWGGVILLGRSHNNNPGGIANIEGIAPTADTQFGGGTSPDLADNSGSLQYVRIEFGGYVYQPNKEINGLTLGAVGSGTTIDHVQVSFANDDAFEFFGGTVNCRYLVSYRNLDDDFDTDNGYSGIVQFGLVVRDPNLADNPSVSTSEGFESDNNPAGDASTPQTTGIFTNITLVGPLRGNTASSVAAGYRRGARLRRNSALKIYNSVFMDFNRGIHIDGTAAEANAAAGTDANVAAALKFKNNIMAGFITNMATEVNGTSTFDAKSWFGANNNDSIASSASILVNPYGNSNDYVSADFRPMAGSLALSDADFTDAALVDFVLSAPVVANAAVSYCIDATATALQATATSTNVIKWYDAATGGNEIVNPTPSTTAAGTFNFYATQANAFGWEGPRTLVVVTVNSNPAAPVVTASGSTSFCTGSTVTLYSDQATGNMWSTSETTQDIVVGTSGTYSLVYTDGNGCQATSNAVSVTVSSAPTPTIQSSGSDLICEGSNVTLSSSTADSYLWSSGETTQSITVSAAGIYSVTTTNANSCDGVGQSNTITITVNPQPVADASFVYTSDNTISFTNTSTSALTYSWDFGDFSSSTATNPVHSFADFSVYTVTLTAFNGVCSDVQTFIIDKLSVEEMTEAAKVNVIVYPNPMTEAGIVNLSLPTAAQVQIHIVDMQGKTVQTEAVQNLDAGTHQIPVSVSVLQSGMYFLLVQTETASKQIKFQINK